MIVELKTLYAEAAPERSLVVETGLESARKKANGETERIPEFSECDERSPGGCRTRLCRTHYSSHSWMNVFQDIGASACGTVSNMSPPSCIRNGAAEAGDGRLRS
jgi:hypothetical protein